MNLAMGSLFDGIGGFPLVASRHGITPVWASEIERQPVSITKRHFPDMQHLGDITQIDGGDITPVDIITFGSPCQDLSVAGKRAGLAGERSGLFMEAIRIIKEMRRKTNGRYSRIALWENVPGALSSAQGADFHVVVSTFANIAGSAEVHVPRPARWEPSGLLLGQGWSVAWRILDAQHFGVPQRRRRIFLVADFGGECAGEILFERKSVSRDIDKGEAQRESGAGDIAGGVGAAGFNWRSGAGAGLSFANETSVPLRSVGRDTAAAVFPTITKTLNAEADASPCVDRGQNVVAIAHCIQGNTIGRSDTAGANGAGMLKEKSYSLNTVDRHAVGISIDGQNALTDVKLSPTLCGSKADAQHVPSVACVGFAFNGYGDYKEGNGHLRAAGADIGGGSETLVCNHAVRRLTPMECERLQGFPDGWTAYGHDGKAISDSARYKALGNSVAVPCVEFIFKRLMEVIGQW